MTQALPIEPRGDLAVKLTSFVRHLHAENLSPRTVKTYAEAARQLSVFLVAQGMPP